MASERLQQLGYRLDEGSLELRHVSTGDRFKFTGQEEYEKVGDAVVDLLHELMTEKYGMRRVELPSRSSSDPCFVFLSSNASSAQKLVILGCGAGRTAAGEWARKICINVSLKAGSVLQFLEWAHQRHIAVLILNPNHRVNKAAIDHEQRTEHIVCAWDTVCRSLPAKQIAIVAHSNGGYDACELIKHRESEVLERLKCIAFTDSGQGSYLKDLPVGGRTFVIENSVDWVASNEPLGALVRPASNPSKKTTKTKKSKSVCRWLCGCLVGDQLETTEYNCLELSAGTASHRETTMVAFGAISSFITAKFSKAAAEETIEKLQV